MCSLRARLVPLLLLLALASPRPATAGLGVVQNLVFAALSDWGGQSTAPFTTTGQLSAAAALARVAAQLRPKLVVSAGGNFLDQGLQAGAESAEDQARFAATFEDVYSADALQVPWYITSGYMDWEGNVTAEMAFNGSSASSGRWIYPDLWHTFTVTVPPFEETIQFVMVDTETLTSEQNQFPGWANVPNLYYPPPPANYGRRRMQAAGEGAGAQAAAGAQALGGRDGGARRLADFDVHTAPPISQEQWAWAERTLSNSSADWLVVIGNDPVWSVGEHGPTWALAEKLLPLMESAGVALYISGRDPIAQHLMPSPSGASVDFVGIGNGAQSNGSQALELPSQALCPDGALAFAYGASTGFVMVEVSSPQGKGVSQLSVSFYDDTGALLYNFSKPNPRAGKGFVVSGSSGQRTLLIMCALFVAVATTLCAVAGSSYLRGVATKRSFASAGKAGAAAQGRARRGVSETTPLVPMVPVLRGGSATSAALSNL